MIIPSSYIVRGRTAIANTAFANAAAPQVLSGDNLLMAEILPGTLSALCTVDAETNTLTISARWQVSNDDSTYYNCAGSANNAANVALATGTSGADATVTLNIPAPDCVYAWKYARIQLYTGVATADGTNDVGAATYSYVKVGGDKV